MGCPQSTVRGLKEPSPKDGSVGSTLHLRSPPEPVHQVRLPTHGHTGGGLTNLPPGY